MPDNITFTAKIRHDLNRYENFNEFYFPSSFVNIVFVCGPVLALNRPNNTSHVPKLGMT